MSGAVGTVRMATDADGVDTAHLHAAGIADGFLPKLGPAVLRRLHRRMSRDRGSFVLVAGNPGEITGFVAGAESVRALYRSFLLRDGMVAAVLAGPRIARVWRPAWETLRYPARSDQDWPVAELLAIAVADHARHQGVGRALTLAFQDELRRRGVTTAKVVVGSGNQAALGLYQSCGFQPAGSVEVHAGHRSEVLLWP
jgi:ribosomal protein S18 acetylase RimI-like enzyme